jgi:hypothetical protein
MEFKNITLFGTDGECVEVLDEVVFSNPQEMYIYCINVAEEYGFVLEKVQTEFLGEECEFYLCSDTGDFKVEVLSC